MQDGRTKGLAILPLGLINASFYLGEGDFTPLLRFNVK